MRIQAKRSLFGSMEDQDLRQRLVPTPFVASWIGRARTADLHDPDPARRAAAWAQWALTSFTPMTGNGNRPYIALSLPGRFYDPRMKLPPGSRPHLEVPASLFDKMHPEFPDRLAQVGNGLLFQWWIVPEVLAVKRALFHTGTGSVADLVDTLNNRRPGLVDALTAMTSTLGRQWAAVESLQAADSERLSEIVSAPFGVEEIREFFPAAAGLSLRADFDSKLSDSNRNGASRRVGVWRLHGHNGTEAFTLGVITPRLTRNSIFNDQLFAADQESPAALLLRGLIVRRLLRTQLNTDPGAPVRDTDPAPNVKGPRLRLVVSRLGDNLPQASVASAVHFLQTYPSADDAWTILEEWAATRPAGSDTRRATLTVVEDGFKAAHRAALRAVRRAEEPDRDDINVILPLVMDSRARVARVTFARPPADESND